MTVVKYRNLYDTVGFQNQQIFERLYATKKFLCDEFIYGGHLLSLGASAIVFSIMVLLQLPIRWEFLLISYIFTFLVYNYDHYKDLETDLSNNSARVNYLKNHRKVLPFILVGYASGFFALLIYFGTIQSIIFGAAILLIGILYTMKFKKLTKKILGFKNIYTSFSVGLFLIFTVLYYSHPLTWLVIFLFVFLFLRFLVNTSFCDIKDMESDKKQHFKTLPLHFGKQKFLLFLHAINLFSLLFSLLIIIGITPSFITLFLLFTISYSFYYIWKAKDPKAKIQFLSGILVDGEFIFWPLFLVISLVLQNLIVGL